MSWSDVVTAINVELAAQFSPPLDNQSPPQVVQASIGIAGVARQDSPPRIVVVPTTDKYGPAQKVGGTTRSLWTVEAAAEVHVWASDYTAVWNLWCAFCTAAKTCAGGAFFPEYGEWNNTHPVVTFGLEYIARVRALIPVTDAPWALAPPDKNFAASTGLKFPDNTVPGPVVITAP